MSVKYISKLKTFTLENLPDLDVAVLGALELFQKEPLPKIELKDVYDRPLVVGSGNAEATGRIMFKDFDAVFASESTYEEKLKNINSIDGMVVVSASGGKHAPLIARTAKQYGKHVTLITNTADSLASKELDQAHSYDEYVFPKNREPYTYNTSTYMGMILGYTKENPADMYRFIEENVHTFSRPYFSRYDKYFLIVPPQFSEIVRMLQVKFIELFGRKIARDVETSEYMKHAVTVVPADELFVSFGEENRMWGQPENRLNVPLPADAGYAAMMAVGYYVIGQIQKSHPPYFKENIADYTEQASKMFGHTISPIVD
ncbi:MAG: hypothetical protein HY567_02110 [Candidatus Kerfeldbacteria bacterium]|nr:hypothetical protein [Candidatus Kerfeldbacteria bacterium]